MLSIFRDQEVPLQGEEVMNEARKLIISSLNKGQIPNWDLYFQELPTLLEAQDLDEIKTYFFKMTEWDFLKDTLALEGTEFFFHSESLGQRLTLKGEKIPFGLPLEESDWQLWLEILSVKFKQNWNVEKPFVSFHGELFGGEYRISLVHASTSPLKKSKVIFRRLASSPYPLSNFGETDSLVSLLKEKRNILVAGSTGSGKTSLLTSLLDLTDEQEHLVILEDTYEILSQHPHQTRFLSGSTPETSLRSYLSYSLRLSPDRIILGEMRSHEVVPFLMAMNTGHKGLMGTIHASSAEDALHRVSLLFTLYSGETGLPYEKVMELLCRNLEFVVFMENKKVKEIIRLLGSEKGVAFFERLTLTNPQSLDSKSCKELLW